MLGCRPMLTDDAYAAFKMLSSCRALELAMADFYEELAILHGHDSGVVRLWKKTACEEMSHAAQFTLLLDTMSDQIAEVRADATTLEKIRLAIETTREDFQQRCPTVHDALVAAIKFEESMGCFHADQIAVFENPHHRRLFKAMMAADNDHVGALRNALTKRP